MSAGAERWPAQPCPCGSEWRLHRQAATYSVFHCRGCYTREVVGTGYTPPRRLPYCPCGGLLSRHAQAYGYAQVQCRSCGAKWEWKDGKLESAKHWSAKNVRKNRPRSLPYGEAKKEKARTAEEKQRLRLAKKREKGLARVKPDQAAVFAILNAGNARGNQVPDQDDVVPTGA